MNIYKKCLIQRSGYIQCSRPNHQRMWINSRKEGFAGTQLSNFRCFGKNQDALSVNYPFRCESLNPERRVIILLRT